MRLEPNKLTRKLSKSHLVAIVTIVVLGLAAGAMILRSEPAKPAGDGHGHGHSEAKEHDDGEHHGEKSSDGHQHADEHDDAEHHQEQAAAKGPHGGQLFKEGDFGLEVLLAEDGGEPRLKVWLFNQDKLLPARAAKVEVVLTRPSGDEQKIGFEPNQDGLRSLQAIEQPHVFEATIAAQTAQEPYLFTFNQTEGQVKLSDAQIKTAGITLDTAGPAHVKSTLQLPGEIRFNDDRTAHVVPRVTGVVEAVNANLGQQVKKGQVLAVISSPTLSEQRSELAAAQRRMALARTTFEREKKLWEDKISPEQDYLQAQQALREAEIAVANANQKLSALGASASASALSRYELRAPFDGMVVEKHIALGEAVKEDANVFTISDLSNVWAEISVAAKDLNLVRVGENVVIRSNAFAESASGKVSYVGALIGEQTRTARARVTLANPKLAWRPGLFVNVELATDEAAVPVTVSTDALQTLEDKPVVFVKVPGGFVPQPVQTGRSDGKRIEVLKGLSQGAVYAAAGSFIVKSELGKSTAEHVH